MPILTVTEVADRWRCSPDTVYRAISAGRLKAFRVGKEYRIRESEVERYEEGGGAE